MTSAAIICDTGALLDYLVATAPDHRSFREAIDSARARYVPGLVLAEVDYFLRAEREAMRALISDLRRGAFLRCRAARPRRPLRLDRHVQPRAADAHPLVQRGCLRPGEWLLAKNLP